MSHAVKGGGVAGRAWAITAVGMAVAGVVLAVLAAEVSQDLGTRRHSACDGSLPMPASGFWFGWLGAGLGATALVLAVVRLVRHRRSGLSRLAVGCAVLGCLFAVLVLYVLFIDAAAFRSPCFG